MAIAATTTKSTLPKDRKHPTKDRMTSSTQLLVERLNAIRDTPRDTKCRLDLFELRERLEAAYDNSCLRFSQNKAGVDYAMLKKEIMFLAATNPKLEFRIFQYKPMTDQDNCLEINIHMGSDCSEHYVILMGKLEHNLQGKIVKEEVCRKLEMKQQRRESRPNLKQVYCGGCGAGDNSAEPPKSVRNFVCLGKASNSTALALERRSQTMQINLSPSSFGCWPTQRVKRHEVVLFSSPKNDKNKKPAASEVAHFVHKGKTLTLMDSKEQILACCQRQGRGYVIYGGQPLVGVEYDYSQPLMVENGPDVVRFYPWFRTSEASTSTGPLVIVHQLSFVGSKTLFEPLYKVTTSNAGKKESSRNIVDYGSGDSIGSIRREQQQQQSRKDDRGSRPQKSLVVQVAPNVDPVLALCTAFCVEMGF